MSTPASPLLDSLRRQLEGRWERIEEARERYTQLTRQLDSFHWQNALRGHLALLKQTREHEAELTEVLTYVEHRADREQWPREHPGRRVLQELRALRAELESLAHRRLTQSSARDGASLVDVLGELEALVLTPLPQPPGADDPVLFEDWMLSWPSPGRVWLTPKRLLWRPWFGEPVQVPLASLERESIRLLPGWLGVRVEKLGLTLFSLSYAETLASLLRLGLRTAPLSPEQPRVEEVVTSPAYRHHIDSVRAEHRGLAVFVPQGIAFLPASHRSLLDLCRSLLAFRARELRPSESRQLEALVEHLRRLPPDEFHHALRELTRARGGKFWPFARLQLHTPPPWGVRLQARAQLLVVDEQQDLRPFLERHPPGSVGPPKKSWWRKHKVRGLILAGVALLYANVFGSFQIQGFFKSWPSHGLAFAGYALFAWACMSYSKGKGYSVLPGLGFSLLFPLFVCSPLMLAILLDGKKNDPQRSA